MGSSEQPTTNYQQPTTNYQQPTTNYQQPTTNNQPLTSTEIAPLLFGYTTFTIAQRSITS
ncbi:hypothetical protein [Fischerella thermalis]|uniref:hypothetical protein n=1 Tax=Fischerella thermalis TaxID=372787 RepID=UPI00307F6EB4